MEPLSYMDVMVMVVFADKIQCASFRSYSSDRSEKSSEWEYQFAHQVAVPVIRIIGSGRAGGTRIARP